MNHQFSFFRALFYLGLFGFCFLSPAKEKPEDYTPLGVIEYPDPTKAVNKKEYMKTIELLGNEELTQAFKKGDHDLIQKLGAEELVEVIKKGDFQAVLALTQLGLGVNGRDKNGMTAVIEAGLKNRVRILEYLIEQGADLSVKDPTFENTALGWAASNDKVKPVKILIKEGVDLNPKDKWGRTPLMAASERGYLEVVKTLTETQGVKLEGALISAASRGKLEVVKFLLKAEGVNVNEQDEDGDTALIQASLRGHKKIVEILVKVEGVDLNIQNKKGQTALMQASSGFIHADKENLVEVSKILLSKGADVSLTSIHGWTALHYASYYGQVGVVDNLLKDPKLDVNAKNNQGLTAFVMASINEHKEVKKRLSSHPSHKSL